jgi:hypothetical protein
LHDANHSGQGRMKYELSSPVQTLGPWARIPLEAPMSVCVYSVFVLSCVCRSLATGWSPVEGVLHIVHRVTRLKKSGQGPTKSCRAIEEWMSEIAWQPLRIQRLCLIICYTSFHTFNVPYFSAVFLSSRTCYWTDSLDNKGSLEVSQPYGPPRPVWQMTDPSSRQRERPTSTSLQQSDSNKDLVLSPRWVLYSKTDWPTDRRS